MKEEVIRQYIESCLLLIASTYEFHRLIGTGRKMREEIVQGFVRRIGEGEVQTAVILMGQMMERVLVEDAAIDGLIESGEISQNEVLRAMSMAIIQEFGGSTETQA
jgi:hypothetical protein